MNAPPSSSSRTCTSCGRAVDPVRAPIVAVLDGGFAYFCSQECRRASPALSVTPPPVALVSSKKGEPVGVARDQAEDPRTAIALIAEEPAPELPPLSAPPSFVRRAEAGAQQWHRTTRPLRVGALVGAVLAVALGLLDSSVGVARLGLATASATLLVLLFVVAAGGARNARPLERAVRAHLGAPLGGAVFAAAISVALAWSLHLTHRLGEITAMNASLWIVFAAAVAESVAHASIRPTLSEAHAVLTALEPADARAVERKLGDVFELRARDLAVHDLRVVSGSATFDLWGNPALRARRGEGDPIPAGAVVRTSDATVRVVAVGRDRAFAHLLAEALERSSDGWSSLVRALDRAPALAAAVVFAISVGVGLVGASTKTQAVVAGLAASLSVLIPPSRRFAFRDRLAGVVHACRSGAAIRDAESFARASSVRTAVVCMRATIISASPDTCEVEPLADATTDDVLALAAGAELAAQHPIAQAIQRAAQSRNLRPVDVRNAVFEPGFGVSGELASGAEVVVGSRALAFRAHVPTAEHEARIAELETTGRDVVVVARDGRALGLIALQSPLRHGALASMQRLRDVEVDPVLLGGGTRGRLEAIGKAIDVEHVRPEIPARDRGAEVRRIAQSAGLVAVIGRRALDGTALAAADVAIALGEAGTAPDRPAVALAHDQLLAAVDVLALAQATRARASATLAVGLVPVLAAALPVAFGLVRPTYAPLAALAATVALGVRDLVAAALPEGGRMEDNSSS